MSFIKCYDHDMKLIGKHYTPFDVDVNCHEVDVWGGELYMMKLRGKCEKLTFVDVFDFKKVDLSGFMDLEIGYILLGRYDLGLLKILELNCKKVLSDDKQLEKILNKYVEEEPDPLMRDIQGFKLEMAVNGFGEKL